MDYDLYSCGTDYNYAQDRDESGNWYRLTGNVCPVLNSPQVDATDRFGVLLDSWMIGNSNDFNQDCVWWGRGQLQVTNPEAYWFVDQLAQVAWPNEYDVCESPNLVVPSLNPISPQTHTCTHAHMHTCTV